MRKNSGLTLIELLLTLALLSLLISILLPTVIGAQKRAYDNAAIACANIATKAMASWQVDHPNQSSIPNVDDIQSDLYGGVNCTAAHEINLEQTISEGTTNYSYNISHTKGRNIYTITPLGMSVSLKP